MTYDYFNHSLQGLIVMNNNAWGQFIPPARYRTTGLPAEASTYRSPAPWTTYRNLANPQESPQEQLRPRRRRRAQEAQEEIPCYRSRQGQGMRRVTVAAPSHSFLEFRTQLEINQRHKWLLWVLYETLNAYCNSNFYKWIPMNFQHWWTFLQSDRSLFADVIFRANQWFRNNQ